MRETLVGGDGRVVPVLAGIGNHEIHMGRSCSRQEGGEEDPDGIVYIGDGAWGVPVRPVHDARETWYLEKSVPMRHFILLTIHGESQDMEMIEEEGTLIDHHVSRPWVPPLKAARLLPDGQRYRFRSRFGAPDVGRQPVSAASNPG